MLLHEQVPLGANGCAYFPFEELCDRPLGAADYFGLFSKLLGFGSLSLFICKSCLKTVLVHLPVVAEKFHTLALEGIPVFGLHNRTAAYRFVTLVDVCKYPLTYTVSSIFSNQNHSSNLTMG